MEYYNELEIPNYKVIKIKHLNHYKNNYKHSSTDNIFENNKGNNLHKIYNQFLVNPYLIRNDKYRNALFNNNKTQDNYQKNNLRKMKENIDERKTKMNPINYNKNSNYKDEPGEIINLANKNNNKNNYNINIRNQIFNEEKKNRYKEEYNDDYINPKNNIHTIDFPKIKNKNGNTIERAIEYNINLNNNCNDIYFTNNNNKLSLSYELKNKSNMKQYISPIIAKIAKNNYLIKNPYSYKHEYLGPSTLKNNPILYPISTYKFDYNKYIRNYHVNKFI